MTPFLLRLVLLLITTGFGNSQLSEEELREIFVQSRAEVQKEVDRERAATLAAKSVAAASPASVFNAPRIEILNESTSTARVLLKATQAALQRIGGLTTTSLEALKKIKVPSDVCNSTTVTPLCNPTYPYRTADGSCNNLQNPTWGRAGIPFRRQLDPQYDDGIDALREMGLPNPRRVSNMVSKTLKAPDSDTQSHLFMQWGQFLAHDLDHAPETAVNESGVVEQLACCLNGKFPTDDTHLSQCQPINVAWDKFFSGFGVECIKFIRSLPFASNCTLGTREQVNQITAYLDGSNVYGSSNATLNALRSLEGGELRKGPEEKFIPCVPEDNKSCPRNLLTNFTTSCKTSFCFFSGDKRTDVQPCLTSMHTLWHRTHGYVATKLRKVLEKEDNETLFQETRRVVVALLQHITYNEYLPLIFGKSRMHNLGILPTSGGPMKTYDPEVDASATNEFATVAFRFGHSGIREDFLGANESFPFSRNFFHPEALLQKGSEPSDLLAGLLEVPSSKQDIVFANSVRNFLFAKSPFASGSDLVSMNINRGRDHGIPPYNKVRKSLGLKPWKNYQQMAKAVNKDAVAAFDKLYKSLDDIDLYIAGIAENPVPGGLLGPTFTTILGNHFVNLKKGDRFWYENSDQPKPFTKDQLKVIKNMSLASLLCVATNISSVQERALEVVSTSNPEKPCEDFDCFDEGPWASVANKLPVDEH